MPLTPQQQQENFDRKVTGLEDKLSDLEQEQEKIRFRGLPRNSFLEWIYQFNQIERDELKDEIGYLTREDL